MARVTPVLNVTPVDDDASVEAMRNDMMASLRKEMRLEVQRAKEALRAELLSELRPAAPTDRKEDALYSSSAGPRLHQTAAATFWAWPNLDADADVQLEASLWTMPLLVGSSVFGCGASVLLTALLVVNIFVQYAFAIIVKTTMIQPFKPGDVDELLSWRRTTAHDATFYNPITKKGLAVRVCSNDPTIIYGSGQRDLYAQLVTYLGANRDGSVESGGLGPLMCLLSLFAFLLVVACEVNATVRIGAAVLALPRGRATVLSMDDAAGKLSIERLSHARLGAFLLVTLLRLGVCVVLALWGCEFLVHTISIEDLLLNAVALEFVLNIDELLFAALAPSRVLRLIDAVRPLPVPRVLERHWRGADLRAMISLLVVGGALVGFGHGVLSPSVGTLTRAADALCGGDVEFVTTVDGAGIPAWAYPDSSTPSMVAARGFPHGDRPEVTSVPRRRAEQPAGARFFSERMFDVVAQQFGKDAQQATPEGDDACGSDVCYSWDGTISHALPSSTIPGCCQARRTQVPTVDAGPFSVLNKAAETTEDAVRLWNPSCTDTISFAGGYTNLLRAGLSDTVNSELWTLNASLCGGTCPDEKPMCAEGVAALAAQADASRAAGDRGCIEPYCVDVRPFCNLNSASGVRARQLCPSTCGCDDPLAPLALSLPSSGCGDRCARSGVYLERREQLPCTDIAVDDPRWRALMADFENVSQTWPNDWAVSSGILFADLRRHGCAALRNTTDPPTAYAMVI